MTSTEPDRKRSARIAASIHDAVLTPLAQARRELPPFPLRPDARAASYFTPVAGSAMTAAAFELPDGGTPSGVLAALAAHWRATGATDLLALIPRLQELAVALADEHAASSGDVDILCYTLF